MSDIVTVRTNALHSQEDKLRLTVLGTSAAYPGMGQACSGFLVQEGGTNLLVDCGTGILSNLQGYLDLRSVSDIVITHMHADHFIDLVPYRYALRYGLDGAGVSRPRLYLPPGGIEALRQVVAPFSESPTFFSDVFEMSEYSPKRSLQLGDLLLSFTAVVHYIPTYAVTIASTRKVAYSSDSSLCPELFQVAESADLFLCNVGKCLEAEGDNLWGHLAPADAGTVARQAGARRLLLAHLWPSCNCATGLEQASKAFGGTAELAEAGRTYLL